MFLYVMIMRLLAKFDQKYLSPPNDKNHGTDAYDLII